MAASTAGEVCSWLERLDWEQARHSWDKTVETVFNLIKLSGSGNKIQRMTAGRCLFQVLLPGALTANDQQLTMKELLDKVVTLFNTFQLTVMSLLSSSQISAATDELEVINDHISSLVKAREANYTDNMQPAYLIMVLKVVYSLLMLCREVEKQQQLHHLKAHLSDLFRTTYILLKHSLDDIEALSVSHVSQIMLTQLVAVADISLTFDPSLPVLCWKSIGKVVCKSKPHILSCNWTIQPIISQLCVAIETECKDCVDNLSVETIDIDLQKRLKLCRFMCTLLLKLVKEFEEVNHEFADQLPRLLISLHTNVYLLSGNHIFNDVEETILLLRDPLVSVMSSSEVFIKSLLVPSTHDEDYFYLSWLLCLLALIKVFPQIPNGLQEYLMSSISSREDDANGCKLLDAVFLCLENCYVQLSLPLKMKGIMYSGNPLRWISIYELVTTHLCAMVQSTSVDHFQKFEVCLMKQLLSSHPYCSLMASDVWTFMSRLAGDNVTENHITVLSELMRSLPIGYQCLAVCKLIQRLAKLLSEETQKTFVSAYPPTVNYFNLWTHISIKNLHESVASEVCLKLFNNTMSTLKTNTNSHCLVTALQCLCNVYYDSAHLLPDSTHHEIFELIPSLLTFDLNIVCQALKLVSLVFHHLPLECIKQVFQEVSRLVDLNSVNPQLAITLSYFISQCCTGCFHSDVQSDAIKAIIKCYLVLLSNSHWLTCHTALESFKAFAEVTPYPAAVEQCIPPALSELVVQFLHKVPHFSHTVDERMVHRYFYQQAKYLQDRSNVNNCLSELSELKKCWNRVKSSITSPTQSQLKELMELCSEMNSYCNR